MTQLPLVKVKRLMKFDPDVSIVSNEAAVAVAVACELFIKAVAEQAAGQARLGKRKTIRAEDFDACVKGLPWMEFLDGCIEGWLDPKDVATLNEEAEETDEAEEINPTDPPDPVEPVDSADPIDPHDTEASSSQDNAGESESLSLRLDENEKKSKT